MRESKKGTALVTGASKGIGRAIARRLAREYEIVALARSADELEALRREIEAEGGNCRVVVADLADGAGAARALEGIECDVLVNNAGVGVLKPFLELTAGEWHRMIDVNLNALYHVTRAVLPGMVARGRGQVVVIGSIAGRSAFAGGTAYTATKHAVMAFTESLMLEVRDKGVKVAVVNPGSVRTDFGGTPGKDWAVPPEDVAESVAFVLAQPEGTLVHRLEVRAAAPRK